jgi:hypothetical protein
VARRFLLIWFRNFGFALCFSPRFTPMEDFAHH